METKKIDPGDVLAGVYGIWGDELHLKAAPKNLTLP